MGPSMPTVHGAVDEATRCPHWDGPLDVVAIRCPRCERYHPCYRCHDEAEDHAFEPWPADRRDARAVLCGACRTELTIAAYLAADDACPGCGAGFNPGCADHHDRYFASES